MLLTDRITQILQSTSGLYDSDFVSHVKFLLSPLRLAAILTTGMHTAACRASETNTRRSMESHRLYTELCIGSGECTAFAIWC